MKIVLRGLNGEFVNFDNVFKIEVVGPHKVIAYHGSHAGGYNDNECILFEGTEDEVKQWQFVFEVRIKEIVSNLKGSVHVIDCPNLLN